MKAILPRGIQLFKLGRTNRSWYFSVFGRVTRESLREGAEFSQMRVGMASLLCEGRVPVPFFYAFPDVYEMLPTSNTQCHERLF